MKKLSVISLSLVLALSMMPVTAFAASEVGNTEASYDATDLLTAQQSAREIKLVNGVSTEELTISTGETVDFTFDLAESSMVGFVLYQKI